MMIGSLMMRNRKGKWSWIGDKAAREREREKMRIGENKEQDRKLKARELALALKRREWSWAQKRNTDRDLSELPSETKRYVGCTVCVRNNDERAREQNRSRDIATQQATRKAGGGRAQLRPYRPGRHAGGQRTATTAPCKLSPEKLRA